jgi:hypothetical protein
MRLPKIKKPIQKRGEAEGVSTRAVVLANDFTAASVPAFETPVLIPRIETRMITIMPIYQISLMRSRAMNFVNGRERARPVF